MSVVMSTQYSMRFDENAPGIQEQKRSPLYLNVIERIHGDEGYIAKS